MLQMHKVVRSPLHGVLCHPRLQVSLTPAPWAFGFDGEMLVNPALVSEGLRRRDVLAWPTPHAVRRQAQSRAAADGGLNSSMA